MRNFKRVANRVLAALCIAGTVVLFALAGTGNRTEDQMGSLLVGGLFMFILTIVVCVVAMED
jgi:hypothetical protein